MNRRLFIQKSLLLSSALWIKGGLLFTYDNENVEYVSNPALETILPQWQGNPVNEKGRFLNMESERKIKFDDFLRWKLGKNPQKKEKKNENYSVPVLKTDAFLNHSEDTIVWLGHSSFFIRMDGKHILIDPVFDGIPAIKRWSKMPCKIEKFVNIDYILVSHSHYDHCDKSTLKILCKQNPKAQVLTGLKLDTLLRKWAKNHDVQGAGWYQKYNTPSDIKIIYLPARHRSNRSVNDENKTLWGAFVIKTANKSVYFGGDSGYGQHFKEVGELFPNIDVALIAIGAYAPRWFMAANHKDPAQAAQAFNETKARMMIPMHFGTFDQTDEPRSEPPRLLKEAIAAGKVQNKVVFPAIGADVLF